MQSCAHPLVVDAHLGCPRCLDSLGEARQIVGPLVVGLFPEALEPAAVGSRASLRERFTERAVQLLRFSKRAIVAAVLALAACATPYQESGFAGGVRAEPMGGDVYRVTASLNAMSDQARLQDFLLLRAADTAIEHGAIGFVILGAQGNNQVVYAVNNNYVTPLERPGGMMMVRLVRQPEEGYLDAEQLRDTIGARVR